MAHQTGNRTAKGNARNTGAPGPTPAPAKTYKNPVLVERDMTPGYGTAKNLGPSSVAPGVKMTSPLADELKRVNALGDQGDHLQDIIAHGTSRNSSVDLLSPQLRKVNASPIRPAFGMKGASPGPKIPAKLGGGE